MGKLIGLILMVLAVWVGLEVYDKGVDHAFGGVFAWFETPLQPDESTGYDDAADAPEGREVRPSGSLAQRVGAKVQSDLDEAAERRGETDGDDNN